MVSVIIPNKNRYEELKMAIESVMNQTYSNVEIIVVDDFSDEEVFMKIKNWIEIEGGIRKIKIIRNTRKAGPQGARITGIENAKGEFIAFLDSDDLLTPNSIEVRLKALKKSGFDMALVYGDLYSPRGEVYRYKSFQGTFLMPLYYNSCSEKVF